MILSRLREIVSLYDLYHTKPFTVASAGASTQTLKYGITLGIIEVCGSVLNSRQRSHPNVYRFKPDMKRLK